MKTISKYILASLFGTTALLGTTSCSEDSLDIVQKGVLTTDTYVTADDETVESFIAAVYTRFRGDYSASSGSFGGDGSSSWGVFNFDLIKMSDEESTGYLYNESSEGPSYQRNWAYFYKIAYWCNMIIEKLPANKVASEAVKSRAIAEAHAMRAIAMMYLVQLWGDAPLADHVMTGEEGNTPAAESWAWIEKEFDTAAAGLPSKGSLTGQEAIGGRMSKEACFAYKGKAQLWQKKYAEAARTLHDQVIATGFYALEENFDDINLSKSDFGPENIFEFNFDNKEEFLAGQETSMDIYAFGTNAAMCYGVTFPMCFLNWGNGSNPPAELYHFFLTHDGAESARMKGSVLSKDDFNALTMNMNGLTLPLANNEGYFRMRNICRSEDCVGQFPLQFNKKNTVYMRYAEVLLNYAEAVAMGGPEGALTGLQALNLVRQRAGLDVATSLSMDDPTYGVKAERRAELYNDNIRYIDCVRWGDAATAFAKVGTATYQFTGEGTPGAYEAIATPTGFGGWKPQYALFPIPSDDVNNNPALKQNAGW